MTELHGKVAIVTGAGRMRGMGRATAVALARAGADVVVTGTGRHVGSLPADEQEAGWRDIESVADEIRSMGQRALPMRVDVTSSADVGAMVEGAVSELGRIDILVNIAAYPKADDRQPAIDLPESTWRKVLDVDLTGTFLCSRAVARQLISQGEGGRIVNFSSLAGKRAKRDMSAYAAAKFGVIGLTQALALELGPHGINVNCVCPGSVDTSRQTSSEHAAWERDARASAALGRIGLVDEIAAVVVFLVSPGAAFVSGQSINVDGGRVMH
jgi:NAD(P)-dependent dehydrogenase (short-subunit alcohol dehydrogenase family)